MKNLKKDLGVVNKELKALAKKTESMMKMVDTLGKSQTAKKKPKAKAVKAKTRQKASPKKRTVTLASTDQVINIIKGSKKGIDVSKLKEITGFDDKKISNIVHRAFKKGKIKRVGRGVYKVK